MEYGAIACAENALNVISAGGALGWETVNNGASSVTTLGQTTQADQAARTHPAEQPASRACLCQIRRPLVQRPFAELVRAVGNSEWRIGFRHILPNAIPTILVQLSVTIGFAILLTAGLSFVGAGVKPPTPELGSMIASGAKKF